jgi:hypothetical protein
MNKRDEKAFDKSLSGASNSLFSNLEKIGSGIKGPLTRRRASSIVSASEDQPSKKSKKDKKEKKEKKEKKDKKDKKEKKDKKSKKEKKESSDSDDEIVVAKPKW